jgi:hypothetical protein
VAIDMQACSQRRVRSIAAHLAWPTGGAAVGAVTEGTAIGLHGPLPPPSQTTYLRERDEWAALAEADATKWFTNHRGKSGLPLLEDDYLFQNPDHPCVVPYLPAGHSASDKRTAILIMPGGGYHWYDSRPKLSIAQHNLSHVRQLLSATARVLTYYDRLAPFEGPPIGRWCGEHGIVGFVLRYRLLREDKDGNPIGYTRSDALADAAAAMK